MSKTGVMYYLKCVVNIEMQYADGKKSAQKKSLLHNGFSLSKNS